MREGHVTTWQGMCIIVGMLLLNNPDIEMISAAGVVLMMLGYIPLGVAVLRGERARGHAAPQLQAV